jgi:hypothetical protein
MTHSRKWSWLKAWGMTIARHAPEFGCRAVFERSSCATRWRLTGWLGRRDSHLCISVLSPLASVIAETFFGNEAQHDKVQSRCAWSNPSARA